MAKVSLNVNGKAQTVDADPDMPLLYALRNDLGLNNPQFGCGLAQCGACTVHIDGNAIRSCVTPISSVGDAKVVTMSGLGTPEKPHPLQTAYVEEEVTQCGYCINGWVMTAAASCAQEKADRRADQGRAHRAEMPLRHAYEHHARDEARSLDDGLRESAMTKMDQRDAFSRRSVMKAAVRSSSRSACRWAWIRMLAINSALAQDGKPALVPDQLSTYIAINADGAVTGFFGKMDMGQGLATAISQMIAEELDVPVKRVKVVMGDTALTVNQGGASGSNGVQNGGKQMRAAAAEARRVLVEMAAEKLGMPADQLTVTDGTCSAAADAGEESELCRADRRALFQRGARLEQADRQRPLCAGQGQAEDAERLQDRRQVDQARRRGAESVRQQGFVTDVKRAGHGACAHDPAAGGRLGAGEGRRKLDQGHPGRQAWCGTRASLPSSPTRNGTRIKASRALKVEWSNATPPFPDKKALYDHIRKAPVRKREVDKGQTGNVDEAFKTAARVIEAEYEWPFQSHACMGPACAVVEIKDGQVTVWTGSQKPHYVRDGVAATLEPAAGQGARHLGDRARLLRPQRRRRRRDGCRRHRQGDRPAGARAIYARARHRLGSERPGLDPQGARRDRRVRQGHRATTSSARASRAIEVNSNERQAVTPRWRGNCAASR